MKKYALVIISLLSVWGLTAEELKPSVGLLLGVSLANQSTDKGAIYYVPPPIPVPPVQLTRYVDTWAQLNATVYLDAIYAYVDASALVIPGQIHTKLNDTQEYDQEPSAYGLSSLNYNLGFGAKMPLSPAPGVIAAPVLGLDLFFGRNTVIALLRIGAVGDFMLDQKWYLRVALDYSCSQTFAFIDIKSGVGLKL